MSQLTPDDPLFEAVPEEPPSWPKVVGIISIVLGGLGLVCNGCGSAYFVIGPSFFASMMKTTVEELPPNMKPGPEMLLLSAVALVISVLLIFAGAATTRRRGSGRLMHLAYAAVQFPLFGVSMWLQWRTMLQMRQWIAEHPESPFSKGGDPMAGFVIGLVIGAVIGLAYPCFLLVWFGLIKRDAASMGRVPDRTVI